MPVMKSRSLAERLHRWGQIGFALLFTVVMCTPNWRSGLFSWFPIWQFHQLQTGVMPLGIMALLPFALFLLWLGRTWLRWRAAKSSRFDWGPRTFWLPFAGLSLLGMFSLRHSSAANALFYLTMILVAWAVYLYVVNERPQLTAAIGVVLLIQGTVALAQFYLQHEAGLGWLGEPILDLGVEGTSVLWARGHNWLRGYGLTSHPNVLGTILCIGLLLYLPQAVRWTQWSLPRQLFFSLASLIGISGLFLSFSRAAWLAFAAGILTWCFLWWRQQQRQEQTARPIIRPQHPQRPQGPQGPKALLGLILVLPLLWLFVAYYDLAFSRFLNLDSEIEATSISERVGSAEIALQLIMTYPIWGVGLGRFVEAAQMIDPNATQVHNVPLLVAAELGIGGLLLWLWLVLAPFGRLRRGAADIPHNSLLPSQLAPWVAMIVLNLFDTTLWLGTNWQTALLFVILAANLARPMSNER